ncbi:M20 family metallo-hydrolase [Vibrio sp.]|nr:M20 family metallo-hydrolase [Vibrio sp.]
MDFSIQHFINSIASFSVDNEGVTRFPCTQESLLARQYIKSEMERLDLDVMIDCVGNVRGRLLSKDTHARTMVVGSHYDSVRHAGKYDGVAGIASGLAVIARLQKEKFDLPFHLEIIAFEAEEGCEFKSPFIGSKAITDQLTIEDLKGIPNSEGISYFEACINNGLNPNDLSMHQYTSENLLGFLELHIEQAASLDNANIPVGIVTAISGLKRIQIDFLGQTNHAGATPMNQRRDAMMGASGFIQSIPSILSEHVTDQASITAGRITCFPNRANIIPGKVSLEIDVRDTSDATIEVLFESIQRSVSMIGLQYDLNTDISIMGEGPAVTMDTVFVECFEKACEKKNVDSCFIHSGAGHDAGIFYGLCPVGMLFVPSHRGFSHNPQEFTEEHHLEQGTEVLYCMLKNYLPAAEIKPK